MAISFVNASQWHYTDSGSGSGTTIPAGNLPTGLQDGDVLIIAVSGPFVPSTRVSGKDARCDNEPGTAGLTSFSAWSKEG